MSYLNQAKSAAVEAVEEFADKIAEALLELNYVSLYDLDEFDEYHYQTHFDEVQTLLQAATALEELDSYLETDGGLWEGLPPRDAIQAQANYTFGNAVIWMADAIIEDLQADPEIDKFLEGEDRTGLIDFIKLKLPNFYPTTVAK